MKRWMANTSAAALMLTLLTAGGSYADADLTNIIGPKILPTVGKSDAQKGASIVLREKDRDSWDRDEEFVFMLPEGVTWGDGTKVNGEEPYIRGREMRIYFKGTRYLDEIAIDTVIDVQKKVGLGDVEFSVQNGPVSAEKSRIAIAKVSEHGLVINPRHVRNIAYGDRTVKSVRLELSELIDGSLIQGMGYELTLENAKFDKRMTPSVKEIDGIKRLKADFSEDALILSTDSPSSKTSWEIVFGIIPDENYAGDIVLTLKGRENNEKTVIATVNKDLETLAGETKNISLGYKDQSVTDITITENKNKSLMKGSYSLKLEPSHSGNSIDSAIVEVMSGDLKVENIRYQGNELTFDVTKESNVPSTVVIKDVKMTMSNAAYLGEYKAKLVMRNQNKEDLMIGEFLWFNATAPTEDPAKPLPKRVAQFVVDDMNYTLFTKGVKEEKSFDVAPYIESGRTMMSVKAVAEALDMDVSYDAKTKEITISGKGKEEKAIKFTIDQKTVQVNGESMSIDVAPMVKDGRTFVPVSYVGKFFDVKTSWNSELKMITLTLE